MQKVLVKFRGQNVPIQWDKDGSFTVSIMTSLNQKKFFFTDGHASFDGPDGHLIWCGLASDWVPITSRVPHPVKPRPKLPDGMVMTIQDLVEIYHDDEQLTTYEEVIKDPKNLK